MIGNERIVFPRFLPFFLGLPRFLPFFLGLLPLVSCRSERSPHDVKCEGWRPICANINGIDVGPARVGSQVVIDCLDAFVKPEVMEEEEEEEEEVEWVVEEWRLPTNRTNHFEDDDGKLHLVNVTAEDDGNYSCRVFANLTSPNRRHLRRSGSPLPPLETTFDAANRSATITWPLKVYRPPEEGTQLLLIWIANLCLAVFFIVLLFVNWRRLRSSSGLTTTTTTTATTTAATHRTDGGVSKKVNRVSPDQSPTQARPKPDQSQRRNSTKYGTLDGLTRNSPPQLVVVN